MEEKAAVVREVKDVKSALAKKLPSLEKEQIDFLEKCLELDPLKRWSTEQLMGHDYFKNFGVPF